MFKIPLDISAHSLAHAIMFVYSHVFPLNTKAFLCAVLFLHFYKEVTMEYSGSLVEESLSTK